MASGLVGEPTVPARPAGLLTIYFGRVCAKRRHRRPRSCRCRRNCDRRRGHSTSDRCWYHMYHRFLSRIEPGRSCICPDWTALPPVLSLSVLAPHKPGRRGVSCTPGTLRGCRRNFGRCCYRNTSGRFVGRTCRRLLLHNVPEQWCMWRPPPNRAPPHKMQPLPRPMSGMSSPNMSLPNISAPRRPPVCSSWPMYIRTNGVFA